MDLNESVNVRYETFGAWIQEPEEERYMYFTPHYD